MRLIVPPNDHNHRAAGLDFDFKNAGHAAPVHAMVMQFAFPG